MVASEMVHDESGESETVLKEDGTVGEELVVRSLPPSLYQRAQQEEETNLNQLSPDDEFFMDQDPGGLDDPMVFSDGLPVAGDGGTGSLLDLQQQQDNDVNKTLPDGLTLLRRRRESESEGFHIVYKRAVPATKTDYGAKRPCGLRGGTITHDIVNFGLLVPRNKLIVTRRRREGAALRRLFRVHGVIVIQCGTRRLPVTITEEVKL
ncbi:hypothetical protein E2C01_016534 [Portunus trituberculatus]|uniref:Uncharacterized protein n=1 Tax=Portunus trituberculatus TaxID=210409 RepID=A0A5B7DR57_PORTR|nr:hypothetical protein [Portunus trituberculatus]